jgi:hypothetical protein
MEQAVMFFKNHPVWFVAVSLGVGILLSLGIAAFDAGAKEFFHWYGGW